MGTEALVGEKICFLVVRTNVHKKPHAHLNDGWYFVIEGVRSRIVHNLKGREGEYVRVDNDYYTLYSAENLRKMMKRVREGKVRFEDKRKPWERLDPAKPVAALPYCVIEESPGHAIRIF
ncbi:MAG: hypothetical protein LPJ91_05200 [Pseudazoarcus pumilus]|nr:hypothetical protein [Pseudazoarcus pumilus]